MCKSLTICIAFFLLWTASMGQANKLSLVNPFVGTGGHGHTFPGASMPFGMMQLSPDTRLTGWDGCGGYHYTDSIIYGFTHTHLSGTGIADYCDILVMPFTGAVQWKNTVYASHFSHKNEKAEPGYYSVLLDKFKIQAELTTSIRSGMHAYTFPSGTEGKILLDLQHRDEVLESNLEIVNEYEVKGLRRSKSWANNQILYFYIRFEKPIKTYGIALNDTLQPGIKTAAGKNIKSYFTFILGNDKTIRMKVGISAVSTENAKMNLDAEIKDFNFNQLKATAQKEWNKELGKIDIKGGTHNQQVAFYSALYHTCLSPNVYTDVNGEYRGTDLKVHKAENFTNYTVFSLWDTHRAFNPLMTIINRKRTQDWINTFLVQYKYGGMLPVWELSGNETFCMIGYHSIPVITDAYLKGIRGFDAQLALKAMTSYAESNRFGLPEYMKLGFVSNDVDNESASKTVEYAFDDWCIAKLAKELGNEQVYQQYLKRAQQYKNLFDPSTQHIRGKIQGMWFSPFKASDINNFFTEGNSWHYSFTAQQDLDGLIKLYGGKENMGRKLEELFTTTESLSGREQSDVTGLIGQYAHGNEPSHHLAYLFNYVGKPWRTQELVHKICTEFYPNDPDGLIGNEDCGQMSGWFVLSALGIYEVNPGNAVYAFGTPLFDQAVIHLENGKSITINAKNRTASNYYVNSIAVNGKPYTKTYIPHSTIENGCTIDFSMAGKPNKELGTKEADMPHTAIDPKGFIPVPYLENETNKFTTSIPVVLSCLDKEAVIYYSIASQHKGQDVFVKYTAPFVLEQSDKVKFYAEKAGVSTAVISQQFYKVPTDKTIKVISKVNPTYTGGGNDCLIDGIIGDANWKGGDWQGYFNKNFEALVDLKQSKPISHVAVHVLQDISPWIMYPSHVIFEVSEDGISFKPLADVKNTVGSDRKGAEVQFLGTDVQATGRYVKVTAVNGGPLPAWHESAGSPTHIFIDEVVVQ